MTVYSARLPDAEVCVIAYTTQAGSFGYSIYDTTRGQYIRETRDPTFATNITSPDGQYFILFKPVRHETELFDIYLEPADFELAPRLLQSSVWISGGSLQGIGDHFRWSRDSKQIAFLWSDLDKNMQLSLVHVDDNQIKTAVPFTKDPSKTFYSVVQEWSADNRYFTVIEQVLNDTHYSFWKADTLQSIAYPFSTTSMVRGVWSPQGHLFASVVRNDRQKPTDLMIFNPDMSSELIKVPLPQVNVQHLMWSPDSNALVLGYLSCKEAICQQQWHYDLFRANGNIIASDLAGSLQNSSNIIGNTLYNYQGHVVLSGYTFDAAWSKDGKRFVYLEQTQDGTTPIYRLNAVDLAQSQKTTLVTYPFVRTGGSIFHLSQNVFFSPRSLEGVPFFPTSDQTIFPYTEAGKINVALMSSSYAQPIILVRGADQVAPMSDNFGQSQYWATDMHDTSPIMIQWSTGNGADKRLKITTANSNGENIHTFDDGWSVIDNASFISNANTPMMGFIGKKDEYFNLYMINLETGEQTLVLENVKDVGGWLINLNLQQTWMAVNAGSSTTGKGALYTGAMNGGSPVEIDRDANTNVVWSSDGEKIALTSVNQDGRQHFRIIGKDGTFISDDVVSNNSTHLFIPMHWSKCYLIKVKAFSQRFRQVWWGLLLSIGGAAPCRQNSWGVRRGIQLPKGQHIL
jgi:hypothetical protein